MIVFTKFSLDSLQNLFNGFVVVSLLHSFPSLVTMENPFYQRPTTEGFSLPLYIICERFPLYSFDKLTSGENYHFSVATCCQHGVLFNLQMILLLLSIYITLQVILSTILLPYERKVSQ